MPKQHPSDEHADDQNEQNETTGSEEDESSAEESSTKLSPAAAEELRARILAHIRHPNYKPVKPKVIAKQLELDEDMFRHLKRAIKRMVKSGELAWGSKHLVHAPKVAAPVIPTITKPVDQKQHAKHAGDRIIGVFRRAAAGFGFVRPAGTPREAERTLDIFIDRNDTLDAASGDTVAVKLGRKPRRGRDQPGGEIVEVIERETHRFVGSYFEKNGRGYVQTDGKIFGQPIPVGDAGAKNVQIDDKVVIEMVRFPNATSEGEGVILQVLGARGQPGVDTQMIIAEYNLPGEFSDDVLHAATAEADKFTAAEGNLPAYRRDLTGETIITIDPATARDFDDAISLTRDDKGFWHLGVHIADVSHFVPPKTVLDREAYERATSVYLPDRVIPMLPEVISNNLASLQPDRVRYTQTCYIDFSPEGVVTHSEVCLGAIKSCRRFTYEEVDEYLDVRAAWKSKLTPPVHKLLGDMHELAMMLRQKRFGRGALELSMREVRITLAPDGQVSGAAATVNTESHQMIEEFMLAANEAVARLLFKKDWPFLRRVHGKPDPRRLKQLTEFVEELGIECESLESRFELQRVLKEVEGKPAQQAVNYAILRSLQQAVYGPQEEGHYALASDCYCHFTSPIRRYPDLTIHRLIRAIVMKEKPINDYSALEIQGEHCSNRERRAEAAERELTKLKLLSYMSNRIGEELDAVITGVEDFGIFVQGTAIPAEGLLHSSAMADDYYDFDRRQHRLTGRRTGRVFRLGDKLKVRIARVDLDRRELDFRLTEEAVEPASPQGNPNELEIGFRERKHVPAGKKPQQRGSGRFSGKRSKTNTEPPRGKKKRRK